jgi:hypothetical protein
MKMNLDTGEPVSYTAPESPAIPNGKLKTVCNFGADQDNIYSSLEKDIQEAARQIAEEHGEPTPCFVSKQQQLTMKRRELPIINLGSAKELIILPSLQKAKNGKHELKLHIDQNRAAGRPGKSSVSYDRETANIDKIIKYSDIEGDIQRRLDAIFDTQDKSNALLQREEVENAIYGVFKEDSATRAEALRKQATFPTAVRYRKFKYE